MGYDILDEILNEPPRPQRRFVTPKQLALPARSRPLTRRPGVPIIGEGTPNGRMIVDDYNVGLEQIEDLYIPGKTEGEVEKYLLDKTQAEREAGGDEFRTFMEMQHQNHAALADQASFARTNPVSVLKGMLGNTASLTPSASTGADRSQTVCQWAGDDAETTSVTVTLGTSVFIPVQTNEGAGVVAAPVRSYAIVRFGTQGFLQTLFVDIGQGTQFTISGSQINIDVAVANVSVDPGGNGTPNAFPTVPLYGQISFQRITHEAPVTFTKYIDQLAGNNTVTAWIAIPPFAKRITVFNGSNVNFLFQAADSAIATITQAQTVATGALMTTMTLVGDSQFFRIQNKDVAGPDNFMAVFELAV